MPREELLEDDQTFRAWGIVAAIRFLLRRPIEFGLRSWDTVATIAEKAVLIYAAELVGAALLLYAVFSFFAANSRYSLTNGAIGACGAGVLVLLVAVYCWSGRYGPLRAAFVVSAVIFPIAYSLTHGCDSLLHNGGTTFIFVVPSTGLYLLSGGTRAWGIVLIAIHLFVLVLVHGLELIHNRGGFVCPSKSEGIPSVVTHIVGNLTLTAMGIGTSLLLLVIFKRAEDDSKEALLCDLRLTTELAHSISRMNLESAMELKPARLTPLQDALFDIVENLERFRPFLPDSVLQQCMQSDDDEPGLDARQPSSAQPSPNTIPKRLTGTSSCGSPAASKRSDPYAPSDMSPGFTRSISATPSVAATPEVGKRIDFPDPDAPRKAAGPSIQQGLTKRSVTLMVIDLGFGVTAFPSPSAAEEGIGVYFAAVAATAKQFRGMLVSFDGFRAVVCWNGVTNTALHPVVAAQAALHLRNSFGNLARDWAATLEPRPSIAVVSDVLLVGNMGTAAKKQFVHLGLAVRRASELCVLGRRLCVPVLANSTVFEAAKAQLDMRPVDVVGAQKGIRYVVYELVADRTSGVEDEWMYALELVNQQLASYLHGFKEYQYGEMEAALQLFAKHLSEQPTDLQGQRLHKICKKLHSTGFKKPYVREIFHRIPTLDVEDDLLGPCQEDSHQNRVSIWEHPPSPRAEKRFSITDVVQPFQDSSPPAPAPSATRRSAWSVA